MEALALVGDVAADETLPPTKEFRCRSQCDGSSGACVTKPELEAEVGRQDAMELCGYCRVQRGVCRFWDCEKGCQAGGTASEAIETEAVETEAEEPPVHVGLPACDVGWCGRVAQRRFVDGTTLVITLGSRMVSHLLFLLVCQTPQGT